MLRFWLYHARWGEVWSNALWILHVCNSTDVSAAHHYLFACPLLSRRPAFTIFCMLPLCLSLFPLIQDASPQVVFMDILNYLTIKLITSVEFSNAPSSSTNIHLHGCCWLFSVVRMKWMIQAGNHLDAVGNTHNILVFS